MANVRTQIRSAVKTALDAGLSALAYEVHDHRVFAINATDKAIVDMGFQRVSAGVSDVMGLETVHMGELFVRITRTDNETTITDLLEADEALVASTIQGVDWSSLLEDDPRLQSINYSDNGDADSVTASLTLQYAMEYRINYTDHETVIP